MKRIFGVLVGLVCISGAIPAMAQTAITADGVVESTTGGFKFPDGTTQTSAAVAAVAAVVAAVEDTGQTLCYDSAGTLRACAGTGEDGEFQAGVTPPTPRFTDNGNGTITDNMTRLIWLQDANCTAGTRTWQAALDWINMTLNAGGTACANYTAGTSTDWRLPNVKEHMSLADHGGSSPVLSVVHPFLNVVLNYYWGSSTFDEDKSHAWVFGMRVGFTRTMAKSMDFQVLAVRGPQ